LNPRKRKSRKWSQKWTAKEKASSNSETF
jgi:hypothetical protein